MYLESSSYVEKSQILIKLCQMKGKDFDLGGQKKVGDKLNFVLRQFTKQKDWVNVRLGKFKVHSVWMVQYQFSGIALSQIGWLSSSLGDHNSLRRKTAFNWCFWPRRSDSIIPIEPVRDFKTTLHHCLPSWSIRSCSSTRNHSYYWSTHFGDTSTSPETNPKRSDWMAHSSNASWIDQSEWTEYPVPITFRNKSIIRRNFDQFKSWWFGRIQKKTTWRCLEQGALWSLS